MYARKLFTEAVGSLHGRCMGSEMIAHSPRGPLGLIHRHYLQMGARRHCTSFPTLKKHNLPCLTLYSARSSCCSFPDIFNATHMRCSSGIPSRLSIRQLSTGGVDDKGNNLSVFQRFKHVYKEYGKTLIAVHVATSVVWYGAFYLMARSGIDLMPLLVKLGASEAVQAKYSAAGDYLVAYILYEIAKPVRYVVTLAGTRQAVLLLRTRGYIPPLKDEDKLRNLARDGRENLKEKYQERREELKGRYIDKRAEYSARWRRAKRRVRRRHPYSRHSPSDSHKRDQTNHR